MGGVCVWGGGGARRGSRAAALGCGPTRLLRARRLLLAPSGPPPGPPPAQLGRLLRQITASPTDRPEPGGGAGQVLRGSAGAGATPSPGQEGAGPAAGWLGVKQREGRGDSTGCVSKQGGQVWGLQEDEKGVYGLKCSGLKSLWG